MKEAMTVRMGVSLNPFVLVVLGFFRSNPRHRSTKTLGHSMAACSECKSGTIDDELLLQLLSLGYHPRRRRAIISPKAKLGDTTRIFLHNGRLTISAADAKARHILAKVFGREVLFPD